jgi:VanZ family protein
MGLIFWASSDRFSFERSCRFITPIVRWLNANISEHALYSIVVLVRKAAHLCEYAILAVLIWRLVRVTKPHPARSWKWSDGGWTLFTIVLYAASDELHQRFVPSRGPSVFDVLIDTLGAVLALLFLWILGRCRERWQ